LSWDLFIQDLPAEAQRVEDIPDDFRPRPLGSRSELIARIREVQPRVDFSDPSWGKLEGEGFSIEISMGSKDLVQSVALHVRGGPATVDVVATLTRHLGFRALDIGAPSGFFDPESARASFARWREYRDRVVGSEEG